MTTETLRTITVDGVVYGWRVTHRHRAATAGTQQRICVDQFMAFRQGTSRAPLRILFPEDPAGGPGYIQQHGVVEVFAPAMMLNLHRPKTAAALIQRAVELGWSTEPLLVEDGFSFVSALPEPIRQQIAEAAPAAWPGQQRV